MGHETGEETSNSLMGPSEAANPPSEGATSSSSILACSKKRKILLGLIVSAGLVLLIILLASGLSGDPDPGPEPDLVPWLDVSPKHPYSATLTLRSSSDTSSGVEGRLELCNDGGGCCSTNSFVFSSKTLVVNMRDHPDCYNFEINKQKQISVKAHTGDKTKITIYSYKVSLNDGATYHGLYRQSSADSSWSQVTPLTYLNTANDQKMLIKLKVKNLADNPSKNIFVKDSRIEIKTHGDDHAGCFSNPLLWPAKNGTQTLETLETLGTCFTHSIVKAGENLLVRLVMPSGAPFTVSKIVLKTFENQNFGWTVKNPSEQWNTAEFDDDY